MKKILLCCFLCISLQGIAQNYLDLLNVTYINTPQNNFEVSDDKTTVEEINVEFNYPIVINEKTVLLTGLFANKTSVNLDANANRYDLNVIGLNLGVYKTFNDTWSATFMGYPKIAADRLKLCSDQFQFGFLSLFTKKKHANLKYKYGLFANTEKFGLAVLPIFGLYYKSPSKKFEANLTLPIVADINYKLKPKFWLGMRFDGIGTTYNLTEQEYTSNKAYVSKSAIELTSYLRYKLSKSLYINAKVGYSFRRNYQVYDADDTIDLAVTAFYFGDERTQLNEDFADGAVFKIELMYRLHFE